MRVISTMRRAATRFGGAEGGNFALLFGVCVSVLALAAGFAVNTTQVFHMKQGLQNALDAAVTSTARDITTGRIQAKDARASVELFLKANSDAGFAAEAVLDSLVVDQTAKTVTAEAHVEVPLFFPLFGGSDTARVSNGAAALYSDKHVEIAMMLDVTGSMAAKKGKVDKIGDLRTAAKNAVDTVLKNQDPKNPRVRVALVPYASGVNVGALAPNLYAETSASSDLPPVEGSKLIKDETGKDTLPSYSDYLSIVAGAYERPDACATERKTKDGKADLTADGPDTIRTDKDGRKYYALVNRDDHMSGTGMNRCPDAEVIPLTADSKPLLDSITNFKANGYTAGAIAIQWTYYMLSPGWRSAIKTAGLGNGPADHNAKKVSKVAILMTDGQFNTAFAGVEGSYNNQGKTSRTNAESLCTAMKDDGIEIYTIGFDLDNKDMSATERNQAKGVLKNCASKDVSAIKHYYEASTGDELDAAFQAIIANTERLALTQ